MSSRLSVLGYIVSSVLARAINLTSKKKGGKKIKTTPFQKKKKIPKLTKVSPSLSFFFLDMCVHCVQVHVTVQTYVHTHAETEVNLRCSCSGTVFFLFLSEAGSECH